MFFANPIWLWALTGLSIPVAIHLLSRKEGKVIYIGSLRHLQETSTQQFKGIRLNELVLLTLRCLLIIFFVLFLSGLSFDKKKGNEIPWVLVEKGLENTPEVNSQLSKFQKEGYEIRLLASGFPSLADSAEASSPILYRKLIEELGIKDLSGAIVFSKNRVTDFAGMRSSLPSNVKWINVPTAPAEFTLSSYTFKDSTRTRTGHTSAEETYFTTETFPNVNKAESTDAIHITIVSDKVHQYDKEIVEAALKAVEQECNVEIDLANASPETVNLNSEWIIWLTDQPFPNSDSAKIVGLQPSKEKEILIQKAANRWTITKRLNEEIALSENFTIRIASILIPSKDNLKVAYQNDRRLLSDSVAWNNNSTGNVSGSLPSQSADTYLIALLLLTLLVERILAYHKNQ